MDHKVIPRPCKNFDWLLNSSWDHFGLHQGKNVKVTMEFEVPKRHILRPTLSTDMVQQILQWERQKRCSHRKRRGPWQRNDVIIKNYEMFFGEEKMRTRQENGQTFQNCPFVHILSKSAHSLLVHGHSSTSTFGSHLVWDPKAL